MHAYSKHPFMLTHLDMQHIVVAVEHLVPHQDVLQNTIALNNLHRLQQ
jgi:hypothetical protein